MLAAWSRPCLLNRAFRTPLVALHFGQFVNYLVPRKERNFLNDPTTAHRLLYFLPFKWVLIVGVSVLLSHKRSMSKFFDHGNLPLRVYACIILLKYSCK